MRKIKKILSIALTGFLMLAAFPAKTHAINNGSLQGKLEIEAASLDPSLNVQGPKKEINYFDVDVSTGKDNFIALLSSKYGTVTGITKTNWVAVQIDSTNTVRKVINKAPSLGAKPAFNQSANIEILQGGYVLIASDDSYATRGYKKFLAENFKEGDIVKLRLNDQVFTIDQLTSQVGAPEIDMTIDNEQMYTVTSGTTSIKGKLSNLKLGQAYKLKINNQETAMNNDLTFNLEVKLKEGVNYIDIVLYENDLEKIKKSIIVYNKSNENNNKEVVLWIEQSPNSKSFQTVDDIEKMILKAKDAGVTAFGIDAKGPEGFVSYKKSDLSKSPYVSEMKSDKKKGSNPDLDLLDEYVRIAHKYGMKVYASINVFTEGNIEIGESAVLANHPEWEEIVQRPEDKGQLLPISKSSYSNKLLTFVNPANDEVQKFQLKRFEEILKNYDVDGINLDRGRYDNLYADFSEISKVKFQKYLQERGKTLEAWPGDAFKINSEGTIVKGKYYNEWWAFRSGVIKDFSSKVRGLVNDYSAKKGKKLTLSAYVGSWYESLYQNGINWASPDFKYDKRLALPEDDIYTEDYQKTGYIDNLDFIMIGTYYKTSKEVNKYITLGNIITNGELPIYAGMSLPDIPEPAVQREVFQTALTNSSGLMLFDLCYTNWPIQKAAIKDKKYIKDFQLGISNPKDGSNFIEAADININRNEDTIVIYNEGLGKDTTGTGVYGVEVAVDSQGKVVETANQKTAINWSWTADAGKIKNDTKIPQGGYVISTQDKSGVKTLRQLLANNYNIGDDVRAAILKGYLDYEGVKTSSSKLAINGIVEVLGFGKAEVKINNEQAIITNNCNYSGEVELVEGENIIKLEVFVDGKKTNEKSIKIYREQEGVTLKNTEETKVVSIGNSSNSRAEVIVPKSAIDGEKKLSIQAVKDGIEKFPKGLKSDIFEFKIDNQKSFEFKKPISIAIKPLANMDNTSNLVLAYLDEVNNKWIVIENSKYDAVSGLVIGETSHFTMYAVVDKEEILSKTEENQEEQPKTEDPKTETPKEDKPNQTGNEQTEDIQKPQSGEGTVEKTNNLPQTGHQVDFNLLIIFGCTAIILGLSTLIKRKRNV
ncbi:family 10 glycosylhydrolase [Clostridium swellfunianum]|uniref:family 10 glycosylhydrolase n=1 Tax=Clostridium swellfunianum TaxID=1367462 RepID=UPI00202DB7E8|nr:family 10 glycosylhydrolase [Clostridium swellfunianum]MCM0649865.1 family 10 glycosylhydrolase [Clostridium swellfunianum]